MATLENLVVKGPAYLRRAATEPTHAVRKQELDAALEALGGLTNVPPPAGLYLSDNGQIVTSPYGYIVTAFNGAIQTGEYGQIVTGNYGSIITGDYGAIFTSCVAAGDLLIGDGSGGLNTLLSGPNTLGPLDASALINVPPPAGFVTNAFYDTVALSLSANGDFWVGAGSTEFDTSTATQLLSGPNTLGPLDGSALMGTANNLAVFGANYYNGSDTYGPPGFNSFFHQNGFNTDTSLPGDGTASFANGNVQISSNGDFYSGGVTQLDGGSIYTSGDGTLTAEGGLRAGNSFAAWGHALPSTQPAAPTTLAQVITILQSYGLCH